MASTYSNLKIQLMSTGENNTTWGNVTNTNLGTALEEAIAGTTNIAFSNANVTLTLTDTNSSQAARNMRLVLAGTATAGYNLIVPAIQKAYIVSNLTDGAITVKNATGTGIAVPAGKTMWVYNDTFNVADVVTHLSSLTTAGITATSITATSVANGLGAVGTPSYTFTGDTNTGIFSPAADTLAFVEGGVEAMRIDSVGNVIIGSTSGAFKLDVPTNAVHFLETVVGSDAQGWSRTVTASGVTFIQAGSLNSLSSVAQPIVFGNMYGVGIERLRILATGGITSPDLADAVGYKGLPQNSQTATYTLALSDMGKHISITTGNITIDATVLFPVGATVVIYNDNASTSRTITLSSGTLRLAGTTSTGSRTLAPYGLATCVRVKNSPNEWVVSGNVT